MCWRKGAEELRGCLKANSPMGVRSLCCWVGVCGYENKESKLRRVCWRKGAEELRGRLKANTPVECESLCWWVDFSDVNVSRKPTKSTHPTEISIRFYLCITNKKGDHHSR